MDEKLENLPLEKGKLYLVLENTDDDDGFSVEVYDMLESPDGEEGIPLGEPDNEVDEDNLFLSCLLRGMIEVAINDTQAVVQVGMEAFKRDYAARGELRDDLKVVTEDGFPKTVGNA